MRLLLIEDDRPIARGIQSSLEQAGFTVDMVHDGIFAEQALAQNRHELVILDLGLPGIDGMTLLTRFRQTNRHTPVIVLTARDELNDRIQGLNSGADDYMLKPFEPAELEARIRAVMRRSGPHSDMPRPEVSLGGVRLSGVDRRIFNDDKPLELSPREFAVLEMLLLRHGRVVSKAQLQDHLTHFGGDLGDTAIEVTYTACARNSSSAVSKSSRCAASATCCRKSARRRASERHRTPGGHVPPACTCCFASPPGARPRRSP